MPLVIETGAIVPGANSYTDAAGAMAFLTDRGIDVGTDTAVIEGLLLRAMDAINALSLKGTKTSASTQPLPMPRTGIIDADGETVGDNTIPAAFAQAQSWMISYLNDGIDPGAAPLDGVVREKVDVLEIEYTDKVAASKAYSIRDMPHVWALLKPYLNLSGGYIDHA